VKRSRNAPRWTSVLAAAVLLSACGGGGGDEAPPASRGGAQAEPEEVTPFQLEHGIGPFTSVVEPGPIDAALAERGEDIYEMNCLSCHRMEDRFVGPPLGEVLTRRTPTYVLNMIMNPLEMTQRHPTAKALVPEYMSIMPYQNVSQDDALAILEYLRTVQR
jgi:cytochrome c